MPRFAFIVTVETDTADHADQVMAERLSHDEDYGFDYSLPYHRAPWLDPANQSTRKDEHPT